MTMTTTARPQLATHVTLGVTDPDAIATFLRPGVPLDATFWRRFRYQCDHCGQWDTTASGGLWRVSLADDCTDLYYLHTGCLKSYKAAHNLQSVEGRLPLRRPGVTGEAAPSWTWHEDQARIRRESYEAGLAERDALPAVIDALSATWRAVTATDPANGPLTTLYSPDGCAIAYAVGRDDPTLVRVAARLNGDGAATAEAVR